MLWLVGWFALVFSVCLLLCYVVWLLRLVDSVGMYFVACLVALIGCFGWLVAFCRLFDCVR